MLLPCLWVGSATCFYTGRSTPLLSEEVALEEVYGPQHVNDLGSLIELLVLVLVVKIPGIDGRGNIGAKILTEASIFRRFGTYLAFAQSCFGLPDQGSRTPPPMRAHDTV